MTTERICIALLTGGMLGATGALWQINQRLTAIESQPVPPPQYIGEFAAERLAGRIRSHCEFRERTEKLAVLTCSYIKPEKK